MTHFDPDPAVRLEIQRGFRNPGSGVNCWPTIRTAQPLRQFRDWMIWNSIQAVASTRGWADGSGQHHPTGPRVIGLTSVFDLKGVIPFLQTA